MIYLLNVIIKMAMPPTNVPLHVSWTPEILNTFLVIRFCIKKKC